MGAPSSPLDLQLPPRKIQLSIRLDPDVVAYFKKFGPRYQTRINQVLKAFVQAHPKRRK